MYYKKAIFIIILYSFLGFEMIFDKVPYTIIIMAIILPLCIIGIEISNYNTHKKHRVHTNLDLENDIKEIEKLREKFKYDLNGCWISCEGTFSNIMNERWIFYLNGKGITISNSIMMGEYKEEFTWRRKGLFCIEITYSWVDEPTIWIEICYDFYKVPTECGYCIALVELDEEIKPRKGFGIINVPLLYETPLYKFSDFTN